MGFVFVVRTCPRTRLRAFEAPGTSFQNVVELLGYRLAIFLDPFSKSKLDPPYGVSRSTGTR